MECTLVLQHYSIRYFVRNIRVLPLAVLPTSTCVNLGRDFKYFVFSIRAVVDGLRSVPAKDNL